MTELLDVRLDIGSRRLIAGRLAWRDRRALFEYQPTGMLGMIERYDGVENFPGDRGYLGAEGSDEWWVEHISELAGDSDPIAFADEARELALSLREPHIETVFALAEQMDGLGFLPSADFEAALR